MDVTKFILPFKNYFCHYHSVIQVTQRQLQNLTLQTGYCLFLG